MKRISYLLILTSFFAANLFVVPIGGIHLSLFRGLIISCPVVFWFLIMRKSIPIHFLPAGRNRSSVVFMLIWLAYAFVTLFWSPDIASWVRVMFFLSIGVFCTILFSMFLKTKEDIKTSFVLMSIMVAFHVVVGWFEIFSRRYFFVNSDNQYLYSHANSRVPVSLLGNPNNYATLMLFGVFISFACFRFMIKPLHKALAILCTINCIGLLFMTNSRANYLGLFMAIMFLAVLNFKKKWIPYIIGVAAVSSVILLIPSVRHLLTPYVDRIVSFDLYSSNDSIQVRFNLIRNGILFLKDSFGFGVGAGAIEYWMKHSWVYDTNGVLNMHNWWMELLTSFGILIFALYIRFYVRLSLDLGRSIRRSEDPEISILSTAILCCMIGYIIGSISSSSNIPSEWLWVFWAIAIAYQGLLGMPRRRLTILDVR